MNKFSLLRVLLAGMFIFSPSVFADDSLLAPCPYVSTIRFEGQPKERPTHYKPVPPEGWTLLEVEDSVISDGGPCNLNNLFYNFYLSTASQENGQIRCLYDSLYSSNTGHYAYPFGHFTLVKETNSGV